MSFTHLEYANSVWNPHREGLIKDLEIVYEPDRVIITSLGGKGLLCFYASLLCLEYKIM